MTTGKRRAATYLRISLDQTGEGLAIARQREKCAKIIAQRGWKAVGEYSDNSISASDARKRGIVKTCGSACSRDLLITSLLISSGRSTSLPLSNAGAGADEGDEVGCVDGAPAGLGGLDELERHRDPGGPGAGSLGDPLPQPDGGEGATRSGSWCAGGSSARPGSRRTPAARRGRSVIFATALGHLAP